MRSDLLIRGALFSGALALSANAMAYDLIGWYWQSTDSPDYAVNAGSFPSRVGSFAEVEAALSGGLEAWGVQGDANFRFDYIGTTNASGIYGDNTRRISWRNQTGSGGVLAVAESYGFGSNLQDCDIYFYNANAFGLIDWTASANGASWGEMDLEYVAVHEAGHCAGLDHSSFSSAVMFASASSGTGPSARLLSNDDISGLQAIYGVAVGGDLVLSTTDTIAAGQSVTLTVTGAEPGETVRLIASTAGISDQFGVRACPTQLNGECLDLAAPIVVVGSQTASNAGGATFSLNIPSTLPASNLAFQAVVRTGSTISDVFLSNAVDANNTGPVNLCPAGEVPDCNGACYDETWPGDGYCDDGTTYNWGSPDFFCAEFNFDEGDCP